MCKENRFGRSHQEPNGQLDRCTGGIEIKHSLQQKRQQGAEHERKPTVQNRTQGDELCSHLVGQGRPLNEKCWLGRGVLQVTSAGHSSSSGESQRRHWSADGHVMVRLPQRVSASERSRPLLSIADKTVAGCPRKFSASARRSHPCG